MMRSRLGSVVLMLVVPVMLAMGDAADAATRSAATMAIGAEVAQGAIVDGGAAAVRDGGDAGDARASACRSDLAAVVAAVTRVDRPEPGLAPAGTTVRPSIVQFTF